MIILLCLSLATLFCLWGYGMLLQSLFTVWQNIAGLNKLETSYLDNKNKAFTLTSDHCLLGLFFVVFSSSSINLFFPLSNFSGVITLILGILLSLYFVYKRSIRLEFDQLILMIICSIFVFLKIKDGFFYDTGLYRMPMLKWIEDYPIVFGLANLHGRFGFNSAWLMFHGALRLPFLEWNTLLIGETTIFILGLWIMAEGLFTRWQKLPKNIQLLLASILIIYSLQIFFSGIDVETTDNPANILGLITVVYFLEFLGSQNNKIFQVDRICLILVSCSLAITIKVSMLPFILLPVIALIISLKSARISRESVICLTAVTTYFCLWLIRNIALSGCLVYPVSQTCLTFLNWSVTVDQAISEKNAVLGWARSPNIDSYLESLKNYDWLEQWFERMLDNSTIVLVIFGLCLGAISIIVKLVVHYGFKDFNNRTQTLQILILFIIFLFPSTLTGILLWFLGGPDPRFAWSFLLLTTVPIIAIYLDLLNLDKYLKFAKKVFNEYVLRFFCLTLILVTLFLAPQFKKSLLWTNTPVNKNDIVVKTMIGSKSLISLTSTHQCWDVNIPCTPDYYYNDKIRLTHFWIYDIFQRH